MRRGVVEDAADLPSYRSLVRFTKAGSRFDKRLQDGIKVESRAADDLEHVGGGGLLLQRLAQFLGARLHLIEQPHVLDCDYRLVGEG